ncbi:hypothetical protein GE061_000361 [Apolygus lucorum]|uniref:Uncharacterized protein n=1 Tax=Apolygus lucorum TaxID=248454 RepID=A0A6A4KM63_APOLU|nr:hypothetical protein GE061_000361 [Apolygus lucorum]
MQAFLVLLAIFGATGADLPTVLDSIIQETRAKIKNELDFQPLVFKDGTWDKDFTKYDVSSKLETSSGELRLGKFVRQLAPVLYGSPKDGLVETRFIIQGTTVSFDKFSAFNYSSGAELQGRLHLDVGQISMYSLIKMKSQGGSCATSLSTLEPIGIESVSAKFYPETDLTKAIWTDARPSLDYPLNRTIISAAWPELDKVVVKTDLCTLLS